MLWSRRSLAPILVAMLLAACGDSGGPVPSPSGLAATVTPEDAATTTAPSDGPYAGADATIPMGRGPRGVAAAGGSIWVASTIGDVLQRVDPATNRVADEMNVGRRPVTLVTVGDELWVSVLNADPASDDELVRVDTRTDSVSARVQVAIHHNIAVGNGRIWVLDLNGALRSVDPASLVVTEAVESGIAPVALAANDEAVFGIRGDGAAWRWPIAGGELLERPMGLNVPGRSRVAATSSGVVVAVPGSVLLLDPVTLDVLAQLSLPGMTLVNDLWMADGAAWLSANVSAVDLGLDGGSVLELDASTLEVRNTWRLGPESSGVVAAFGSVWAVDQSDDVLARWATGNG